ncbi:hypothetical protein FBU31_007744 [Coemansia sp. 'formosensis']|nr:hypothetical protein FBU31_007744 [Coemansia sp. 'formosensis']
MPSASRLQTGGRGLQPALCAHVAWLLPRPATRHTFVATSICSANAGALGGIPWLITSRRSICAARSTRGLAISSRVTAPTIPTFAHTTWT